MKFPLLFVTSALMSLVPSGAFAQKIETKAFDPIPAGTTTFHWRKGAVLTKTGFGENPTVDEMVRKAATRELTARGFTESASKDGLEVSYMGGVSAALKTDSIFIGDYAAWGTVGGTTYVDGEVWAEGRTYKKSSLVLTVVNPNGNKAVWAERATDNFGDPAELQQRIDKAVEKSFKKFPTDKAGKK